MTKPGTSESGAVDASESSLSPEQLSDEALISRASAARRAGRNDPAAVQELLNRAAAKNRAALDRLAR